MEKGNCAVYSLKLAYCCTSVLFQKVAMRALGFDVKKADVLKILKDYDREATGKITFEDFNEVGMYLIYVHIENQWGKVGVQE